MNRLLIAAAAAFALAGAASAQPAYDASQGAAPGDYPKCSSPGQDRCLSGAGGAAHKAHHRMHHKAAKAAKGSAEGATSRDGERG